MPQCRLPSLPSPLCLSVQSVLGAPPHPPPAHHHFGRQREQLVPGGDAVRQVGHLVEDDAQRGGGGAQVAKVVAPHSRVGGGLPRDRVAVQDHVVPARGAGRGGGALQGGARVGEVMMEGEGKAWPGAWASLQEQAPGHPQCAAGSQLAKSQEVWLDSFGARPAASTGRPELLLAPSCGDEQQATLWPALQPALGSTAISTAHCAPLHAHLMPSSFAFCTRRLLLRRCSSASGLASSQGLYSLIQLRHRARVPRQGA